MKLAQGLYLNEENYQTFEICPGGQGWAYVIFGDFFTFSAVHSDERMETLIDWLHEGKISYIGEV